MKFRESTNKDNIPDDIFFSFKSLRDEQEEKKQDARSGEVVNIYHHNMPKKLEKKPRGGFKIFLVGFSVLIIAGLAFYYYGQKIFNAGQVFTGENVELKIEGSPKAAAGEEVVYLIKYRNLEKIDLSDANLTVNYPTGFVYKRARPLPFNRQNNSWDLGYLRSLKSGEIKITGALIGEEGRVEKLSAELTYRAGGDKSEGRQRAEIETTIFSSVLSLDISGPSRLFDENIKLKIKYKNSSNTAIEDIKLNVIYPEDFIFISSEPPASQDDDVWLINQLGGARDKELAIRGKFENRKKKENKTEAEAKQEEKKIFKAQIGIVDARDVFYLQQEKEFVASLAAGDIGINLELNNSNENSIVNLNDTLIYKVGYTNKSGLLLQNVKLKLIINSNILDWTTVEDAAAGTVADEEIINGMLARSITWNIGEIKANDGGRFVIKIRSKPYSKLNKTQSLDLKAEARVQAEIGEIDGEMADKFVESGKITASVNTELKLQTQVSLQNRQDYKIVWELTNSIHEVEDVKVETLLTEDSDWLAETSVSAGDIYFDPETKIASWQINRIPVGIDIPLVAVFKLRSVVDTRPKLLTNLNLSATDKVTGARIAKNFSEVMGE